jgi:spermidine synthase
MRLDDLSFHLIRKGSRIVHADAVEYLSHKVGVADVILLDGFDVFGLAASLSSQYFYESCYAALRNEGVLVANLPWPDTRCVRRETVPHRGTMRRQRYWIGIKEAIVPGWLDLYARAEAITRSMGIDLCRYFKKMKRYHRMERVSGYPSSDTLAVKHDI